MSKAEMVGVGRAGNAFQLLEAGNLQETDKQGGQGPGGGTLVAAAGTERRAQMRKLVAPGQLTDVGSKGTKARETRDLGQGLGPG